MTRVEQQAASKHAADEFQADFERAWQQYVRLNRIAHTTAEHRNTFREGYKAGIMYLASITPPPPLVIDAKLLAAKPL